MGRFVSVAQTRVFRVSRGHKVCWNRCLNCKLVVCAQLWRSGVRPAMYIAMYMCTHSAVVEISIQN